MYPAVGIAQPRSSLNYRIEHRFQIEGRAADDLQHVAGRGLLFQCFVQVHAIRLGTADRDDRLLGKVLQQRDLPLGEAAGMPTVQRHRADRFTVAQQRDA